MKVAASPPGQDEGDGVDERLMRRAIELARANARAGTGGPFGAVVARGAEIVGEGANHVTQANDPTAHAEVVAIRAACAALGSFSLEGCTLYASCEPCPMCLAAAHWARLDALVYGATRDDAAAVGFDDAVLYREVARPPEGRVVRGRRILGDEAAAAIREWLEIPDRVPY